jgi:hypothetical protein
MKMGVLTYRKRTGREASGSYEDSELLVPHTVGDKPLNLGSQTLEFRDKGVEGDAIRHTLGAAIRTLTTHWTHLGAVSKQS